MIYKKILNNLDRFVDSGAEVRGVWNIEFSCSPSDNERIFNNYIIIVQSKYQGCCFVSEKPAIEPSDYIGDSIPKEIPENRALSIAMLDSLFPRDGQPGEKEVLLNSSPEIKARKRSKIVVDVVNDLLPVDQESQALLIGYVKNIYDKLSAKGFDVVATDRDNNVLESEFDNVNIRDGTKNPYFIKQADVVVATGMTLQTGTLQGIIDECKNNNTKLVVFAQTGSSLATLYPHFGVDAVIRETFPIYDFHGRSNIHIKMKDIE